MTVKPKWPTWKIVTVVLGGIAGGVIIGFPGGYIARGLSEKSNQNAAQSDLGTSITPNPSMTEINGGEATSFWSEFNQNPAGANLKYKDKLIKLQVGGQEYVMKNGVACIINYTQFFLTRENYQVPDKKCSVEVEFTDLSLLKNFNSTDGITVHATLKSINEKRIILSGVGVVAIKKPKK